MHTPTRYIFDWQKLFLSIQAQGRLSFTIEEIMAITGYERKRVQVQLYRYIQKGVLGSIRQGFYVIIPAEYSGQRVLPTSFYIDELMSYLKRDYYVSLLSAAALHGAAHQQPMETFVTISAPAIRDIQQEKFSIRFNTRKKWGTTWIEQIKTRSGYINVSSVEWTMLDLVDHQQQFGLGRILGIVEELSENISVTRLKRIIPQVPTVLVQRLGYLFDKELDNQSLATVFEKALQGNPFFLQPLSLSKDRKGITDKRWNIIVNENIEITL